jgi:transcription elongation factor Elf1
MLPENRPLDYRISTTATEDNEFECDRCNTTECRSVIRQNKLVAQCAECGWMVEDLADLTTNKDIQIKITIPATCYATSLKADSMQIEKRNDNIVLSLHGLTYWVKDYEIHYLTDNLNTKTFKLRYKDPKLAASGFLIDVEISDYNYAVQCINNAPKAIASVGGVG